MRYNFINSKITTVFDELTVAASEAIDNDNEETQKRKTMHARIFLAEDDNDDARLFEDALAGVLDDLEIHRVYDGVECIYALKHSILPDYIFLDLNMPLKNGIDCLKAIRNMPDLAEVPVVIFSTNHQMKDIDFAYKYGAAYYLVKPNSQKKLETLLRRLMLLIRQPAIIPATKHSFVVREIKQGSMREITE